ncbi:MAG: NTP transferase domain-containing protein, partial [Janthinobacterium lividum]
MHTGFAIAIMAAGRGTRLKSRRPKVLHEVGGKSLLLHVIAAASTIVPPSDILCIVGHEAKQVESAVASTGVRFVLQAEQRGTGHAVQQVKSWYAATGIPLPENLLILSGDVPLIRPETLASICEAHAREQAAMTILTAVPSDPTGYGRILRENPDRPEVLAIVEQKQLAPDQLATPEINSGIYCFRTESLFAKLDGLSDNNVQGEFYLTDVASALVSAGERVIAVQVPEVDEVLGANTIAEMMHLDASMRA